MTCATDLGHPNTSQRMAWLLPEDGIVDPLAIDLAVRGVRPVALTATERRIAAALILAAGGTPNAIAKRLRMAHSTARALADQITAGRSAA
jgi:DNA-binding CsgD family transcriptional regulator